MKVTEAALVKRINRKLRADDGGDPLANRVRRTRNARAWIDLGDYYLHDPVTNCVMARHVDIEALGHDLGVLR